MLFLDCPEHAGCLAALGLEPIRIAEHELKRWQPRHGVGDPVNLIQWPWAASWLKQYPKHALQWVNHTMGLTPSQVIATTDWSPDTVTVLDYSHDRSGVLV